MISVIIPVYNVEKYLDTCLISVTNQTYKDIEIILIDDGSQDNCTAICDQWKEKDSRIKVIHQSNRGLSAARNAGLDMAKGDYIYFVDSDDFIESNALEVLFNMLTTSGVCLAIGGYRRVEEDGYYIGESIPENKDSVILLGEQDAWAKFQDLEFIVVWTKLYKAELWSGVRFKEGIIHEDNEILLKIFPRCKKIACTAQPLYNYRKADGIMNKKLGYKKLVKCDILIEQANYFCDKEWLNLAVDYWDMACQLWADGCVKIEQDERTKTKLRQIYLGLLDCSRRFSGVKMPWKISVKRAVLKLSPKIYCCLHKYLERMYRRRIGKREH